MFALPSPVAVSCLCLFFILATRYWRQRKANPLGLPFPPGPPPLPVIGNLHQAPKHHEWLRYTEWAAQYGPIVHFHLLGEHIIIINTHKAAIELLEKRSAIYSDRPRMFVMAAELVGWNSAIALMPSGARHRKHRRLYNNFLSPVAARKLWSLQEAGTQRYLSLLADDPDQFFAHIRTSVSETLVMAIFGRECSKSDFPYVEVAARNHESFTIAASPFTYAVDLLPILRYVPEWFPGASFKRQASIWNKDLLELVHFPFKIVQKDLKSGTARPSFVATHIDTDEKLSREDEKDVMWSAAGLYSGGLETTIAAIVVFILAMCLNPNVQRKAQEELDSVVGTGRLPTLTDRQDLPYLNACIRELLRWHPVGPLGLAHRVSKADYYEGYFIPEGMTSTFSWKYPLRVTAGATVVSNIWAMTRDESVYSSPHEFRPERFLHSSSERPDAGTGAFGFGRRICPGMHFADSSLFIYMAQTLATFNITKAKDVNGREIEPEVEFVTGVIVYPKPFKCSIVLRSERALQLVKKG